MDTQWIDIIVAGIGASPSLLIALAWVHASEKRVQRYEERLFMYRDTESERVDNLVQEITPSS